MSQKPETKFRAWLRPRLESISGSWWESIQQKTLIGTPDILGVILGRFIALELKASPSDQPSPLQALKLQRIQDAGGFSAVVHPLNALEVLDVLKRLGR